MSNILGIFAKLPQPGAVKTRLAAATSPEFAAQAAEPMLRDTLDRIASLNVEVERWLVFAPHHAGAAMAEYAGGCFQLTSQGDGDLGQRLKRFIDARIGDGATRVVVIGADSPTLPIEFVGWTFDDLKNVDLVLGPATDGGYYLVGCAKRVPAIFDGIDWGSSTVLRDTIARLDAATRVALLEPWYDVDTLDDWRMMQGHIAALRKWGCDPRVPHCERLAETKH